MPSGSCTISTGFLVSGGMRTATAGNHLPALALAHLVDGPAVERLAVVGAFDAPAGAAVARHGARSVCAAGGWAGVCASVTRSRMRRGRCDCEAPAAKELEELHGPVR